MVGANVGDRISIAGVRVIAPAMLGRLRLHLGTEVRSVDRNVGQGCNRRAIPGVIKPCTT